MNISEQKPFNIDLLILTSESIKTLIPVTVLDIFDNVRNFHPNGLFSTEIFGKVGEERRSRRFAYIDMKVPIFHPIIFKAYIELKQLYSGIMAGREFAKWNEQLKDFEKSDPTDPDASTGFDFFLKYKDKLVFEKRPSIKREFNIRLVEKYRDNCMMDKLVVMPAGIRDYEVDDSGKPSDNEINDFYRKVLGLSNLVNKDAIALNPESIDRIRFNMQLRVNELYNYLKSLMEGKRKFVLGKWAGRRIFNSTRNVITSVNSSSETLGDKNSISTTNTVVGLYQYSRAILPLTCYHMKTGFLSKVFLGQNAPAVLVNKKTLKKEMVHIDPNYYDDWMTDEGIEKMIIRFGEEDLRHLPVSVGNYYVGLMYKGPDGTYALFHDIDDLPPGRSKEDVRPITFCELIYASIHSVCYNLPAYFTRYPITGIGSVYPSIAYVKTTVKGERRWELNAEGDWEKTGAMAREFPILGEHFVNSTSPAARHLARLTADFDGDAGSFTVAITDEAIAEGYKCLNSRKFYVAATGKMNFSQATDTIKYVLGSTTG